jgi:NAD(P)-dependent dehydrogenase (short-subunit alcohol dehydrogenase family)
MSHALGSDGRRAAVLVTGASTGIGRATVLALARRGLMVFAGLRHAAHGDGLVAEGGAGIRPLLLDVTDPAAIDAARAALESAPDVRLEALVSNAGFALPGPLELISPEALRRQFDVNFFGALALTQALLPLLRLSRGRIVFVSSIGGKFAAPFVGAYAASKFALEAAGDALRLELASFGIAVVLVEPGAVKTPIWQRGAQAGRALLEATPPALRPLYEKRIEGMVRISQRLERRGDPPERVARVIERALFARRPRARYLVGIDARVRLLIARLPEALRDRLVAAAIN